MLVMPPLDDILDGRRGMGDLRDISIEDLIGRHPVDTDVEIDRRLHHRQARARHRRRRLDRLRAVPPDRRSSARPSSSCSTATRPACRPRSSHLGPRAARHQGRRARRHPRRASAAARSSTTRRPEVVFHAAALKHLPMLEQYPDEAWKTNVLGTLNVLERGARGRRRDVHQHLHRQGGEPHERARPLQARRREAHRLGRARRGAAATSRCGSATCIGSRGSMLPTFQALIEAGGPLTVTHPDVTRYFMTIPEACQLVIQAGGIGGPGEVLILDMGEPVRILDVAKRMIAMSGKHDRDRLHRACATARSCTRSSSGAASSSSGRSTPRSRTRRADPISPERLDKAGWEARMLAEHRATTTRRDASIARHRTRRRRSERAHLPVVARRRPARRRRRRRRDALGLDRAARPRRRRLRAGARRAGRRRARRGAELGHRGPAPRAARRSASARATSSSPRR